ncbi:unnamed protein product [Paramecium octaurelia]|uniref:WD40-repeat-containing domain n=1 Tax=Paramecium octaurelia TaxID=43137 RepID=A0A8S1UH32_PAROT|nr:unnamed protein product [Paramecium octaurelia]
MSNQNQVSQSSLQMQLTEIFAYLKSQKDDSQGKSQPGQQVINNLEFSVTALTFNTDPTKSSQLVVAGENKIQFYDVAFNQGSQLNSQNATKTYTYESLKDDTITAIHFPNTKKEKKNEKYPFFFGTKQGKFLCGMSLNQEQNENQVPHVELHQGQISCILQVQWQEELVLLTGGYDGLIKQFKVNFREGNENTFEINYFPFQNDGVLKHGSQEGVFWLSLSEIKENDQKQKQRLIASGYENNFYIWERNTNDFQWHFILKYKRNAFGSRVAYYGSDCIVWQLFQQNYVNILINLDTSVLNNKDVALNFKPENIRKVQLNEKQNDNSIERYDNDKFPLLYHKDKQIMVIKCGNRIYFLKCKSQLPSREGSQNIAQLFQAQRELSFNYYEQYIECSLDCTLGAISPKGDILVVYDSCKKELKYYRLFFL